MKIGWNSWEKNKKNKKEASMRYLESKHPIEKARMNFKHKTQAQEEAEMKILCKNIFG